MMASLMSVPKSHYVEIFSIVVLCEGCVQRPHMANPECVGAPGLFEVRKTSWEYLEYSTPTSVRAKYLKQCKSTRNHYRSKSDRADYISMLLRGHWLQSYSDESALITDYEHKDKGKGKDENKVLYFLKAGGSRISTTSFPVSYQGHPCLQCSFEPRNQDQLADLSSPIWSNFHSLVLSPSFNPEEMLLQGYRVVTSSGVVTGHGKHDNRWWRSTNSIEDWVTLNLSWQNFFSLRPLESSGVTIQNHS